MCGIYGFVSARGDLGHPLEVASILTGMDRSIVHRGPDDTGTYFDGACAMGMRRLSIIDLAGGRQPICNERKNLWVVFNGEIYNYRALRSDLIARGHTFTTSSDTEILVHSYEERGGDLCKELNGMFGFAIWDRETETLTLARDRLGIKPLYYAVLDDLILFGSEMKSLLFHPALSAELDPGAYSHYLSFGTTSRDQSILRGVRKLEPGHILRYRRGEVSITRYWRPEDHSDLHADISEDEAAEQVRSAIRSAVELQLIADVPVGAFLSGGIDSATVVGTMSELGVTPKTFSIGFDEPEFDELSYARQIARRFGTDHHELVVKPDAWALAESLAWHLDEPFSDVSAIPTYLVSKLAASQVKVALSGDGGDEIFAGYERYARALKEAAWFDRIPSTGRTLLGRISSWLPNVAPGKGYLRHMSLDPSSRFLDGESLFSPAHKRALAGDALGDVEDPFLERVRELAKLGGDSLTKLQLNDTLNYLPLDILTKVDRMTMAHSLEARPPFLDHRLVELAFSLPSRLKLRGGLSAPTQKWILKRAMSDLLPDEVLNRPKRGFAVPIVRWFRGALKNSVRDLLHDRVTRERGLLRIDAVDAIFDEHVSGRRDQSLQLWGLCMFELWCRQVLDKSYALARETTVPLEKVAYV